MTKKINMDFFIKKEKNREKIGIIFGVFWCGIMKNFNKKIVHDD
jgi:hypothetical protein